MRVLSEPETYRCPKATLLSAPSFLCAKGLHDRTNIADRYAVAECLEHGIFHYNGRWIEGSGRTLEQQAHSAGRE